MEQGSIFKTNGGQAVRLPTAAAFPKDVTHVHILKVGRSRLLVPTGEAWDTWFASETGASDYPSSRDQEADSHRET